MQLFKAKELAETLMAEHGLFHWGFEFDQSKYNFDISIKNDGYAVQQHD